MTSGFKQKRYSGTVVIYNLITDENDPVTAFALDWIRAFAETSDQVVVFSTHVGRYSLPSNVKVYEVGGGSPKKRLIAVFKLLSSLFLVLKIRGNRIILHHMSEKTACILGPFYRCLAINQGLWYSHNRNSIILKCASLFVNFIFTPTSNSFPIKISKINAIGHGISLSRFEGYVKTTQPRKGIVSIGRISKVKHLEKIIDALSLVKPERPTLTFIGPVMEEAKYVNLLKSRAKILEVELSMKAGTPYNEIPAAVSKYSIAFSGSPNTVDKSVLEAAAVGCFIVSENPHVLELTGMKKFWDSIGIQVPYNLEKQIEILKNYELNDDLRGLVAETCKEKNNVHQTVTKIVDTLAFDEK